MLQSVKGWFRYHEKSATGGEKNPWAEFLHALRAPVGRAPRRLPAWQLYATNNPEAVRERWRAGASIGERNKAAKALFEDLSEKEQVEWLEKSQATHETELARFNASLKKGASDDHQVQAL